MSKEPIKEEAQEQAPKKAKKSLLWRVFKYSFALLLVLVLATGGFLVWICATQSGQNWLVSTLNDMLASKEGGLGVRITALSGTLPLDFEAGFELSDGDGVWLTAPTNHFALDWRKLPGVFALTALQLQDMDISRLPSLPPAPPDPAAKPFTLADLQSLSLQAADFLRTDHWWLPEIQLSGIELVNIVLPPDLLPGKESAQRLRLDAGLEASLVAGKLEAALSSRAGAAEGNLALDSVALDALNLDLNLELAPREAPGGLDFSTRVKAQADNPVLGLKDIPPDLLGSSPLLDLALSGTLDGAQGAALKLAGPDLTAGAVQLTSHGEWTGGPGWAQERIDGPLNVGLKLMLGPMAALPANSPLAQLELPANLNLDLAGDLPHVVGGLEFDLAGIELSGQKITAIKASIATPGLDLPLAGDAMALLYKEQTIPLKLSASVDGANVGLEGTAFFQGQGEGTEMPQDWLAGLRDLSLTVPGIDIAGHLQALLVHEQDPALDGALHMAIRDWETVTRFVPDFDLAGDIELDLSLDAHSGQDASLSLATSQFSLGRSNGEKIAELGDLQLKASAQDLFKGRMIDAQLGARRIAAPGVEVGDLQLKASVGDFLKDRVIEAQLTAGSIAAADLELDARVEVSGPMAGPLTANVRTGGGVVSTLAGVWRQGQVDLRTLNVEVDASALDKKAKKGLRLGIKSAGEAVLLYGDQGLGVRNLDLQITPSGRLRANGSLSRERLDLDLSLEKLDFKPWQALVEAIPQGQADIHASLSGTPARPAGNFELALRDVVVPGVQIPPVSLNMKGDVVNSGRGSSLNLQVRLDPKTLKALGSDKVEIGGRIPLSFADNGVPNLNKTAPLQANVVWDGALGPLWNLAPIPDRRLNGRLGIDLAASGTLERPVLRGSVNVSKARYEDLQLGMLLTDIGLKLSLADRQGARTGNGVLDSLPGTVTVALQASDGRGGTVNVDGSAGLDGNDLDITAKIRRLRPLRRRDIHVDLSGDAQVKGTALDPQIEGVITVNQGEVLLNNLELTGSVTTLPITQASAEQKAPEPGKPFGHLNVRLDMLPRFTVEGRGLTSIWKANLLAEGALNNPIITGNITCVKGNFDFLGKNFALTRGIVFFGGGAISNPLLDIELTNETPNLVAHILLTGPVDKMRLNMSSDPSLPRDDILSQVLFGKSVNELSRYEALQLAAAVAQLAGFGSGGEILGFAKKALGVDVLRLGTSSTGAAGEPGDQTAGGTTIEMGKYLTDKIYLGVQQGFQADSTAFIIQLELTPRTSLEIRTENNNTWGGLNWSLNY